MKKAFLLILMMAFSSFTFANENYVVGTKTTCTPDVNSWGNPSDCTCSDKDFAYDQTKGLCFQVTTPQACTDDINEWGFSSNCTCEAGSQYDQTKGECFVLSKGILGVSGGNVSCSNSSGTTKLSLFRHEGGTIMHGQVLSRRTLTVKSSVVSEDILRQPGYYVQNPDKDIVGWHHLVDVKFINSLKLVTSPGASSIFSGKMKVFLKGKEIADEFVICSSRNPGMYP